MDILRYMEQIRRLMADRGACEVPQFPKPLTQVWFHPDILIAARGSKPAHCFCFQNVCQRISGAAVSGASCMPSFVWLMNCFEKDFAEMVIDFISDLHFAITNSREDSGFSLVADRSDQTGRSGRGCCWQLQYNGVSCGHICLFSELFSQRLARPSVILALDLAKLPNLLAPENIGQPVLWAKNVVADDLLALRAWQLQALDDMGDPMRHRQADLGMELCRLLSLLNSSCLDSTKKDDLTQLISDVSEIVQRLLVKRTEERVVDKNASK